MSELFETAICFCHNQIFQENDIHSYCTRYFLSPCDSNIKKVRKHCDFLSSFTLFFIIQDNKALISHLAILEVICFTARKKT